MALILTEEQQKALLMVYIQSSFLARDESEALLFSTVHYDEVNDFLIQANLPLQIKIPREKDRWWKLEVQKQLSHIIYQQIPANKLNPLLYAAYDKLNEKYVFEVEGFLATQKMVEKRAHLCSTLESLTRHYHAEEIQHSKSKAFKDAVLFSLFIVTIPFCKLFYNYRLKKHEQNNFFREIEIPQKYFEAAKAKAQSTVGHSTVNIQKKVNLNNNKQKVFGLMAKNSANQNGLKLKEIIFNNKHDVRKLIRRTSSGMLMFGAKTQINSALHKLEDCFQEQKNAHKI